MHQGDIYGPRPQMGAATRARRGLKLALAGVCFVVVLLPAACNESQDKLIPFDGHTYRAKASAVDKKVSLADFTITVKGVSQSLDGARGAGKHEGTKYCIAQYGTSNIIWRVGPDTEPAKLAIIDDKLTFAGRCDP